MSKFQYRKRYALLQQLQYSCYGDLLPSFQYRKRYALLQPIVLLRRRTYICLVSIPQAVRAVATAGSVNPVFMRFQKLVLENLKP